MAFDIRDLAVPVIVAPMAGGPSTPELVAAAGAAGALGFLAGGYLSAPVFAERIRAARALTTGPVGANVFVPQPSAGTPEALARYAATLRPLAERYGVEPGEPRYDDDDWAAKLDVLTDLRPEVASFTFGLPGERDCRRLRAAGITLVATVTTAAEARLAAERGMDALVVQGPSAGGHRGTFDPAASPASLSLAETLSAVRAVTDLPVIAAGGLMTADDIARVRTAGAVAAQLGTAFLLADEAGTNPVHRAALRSDEFTETAVTKAFSGRYARGLRNRFIDDHEPRAPLAYPEVHHLTAPVRAAAVRAGDPQAVNLWAGTGFRRARTGSVAAILSGLA
ncbi:nitronate monooxygenase [Mycolicibacterium hassiacum]|nr:nitronate monooxygenase [Mycolicibacterium hassiacum]